MPVWVGIALGRIFAWVAAGLIFRLVTSIGVGVVTYIGMKELLEGAQNEIEALSSGLGGQVYAAFVLMRIDDAIVVVFSAMLAKVAMKALGPGGAIGSFFVRPPVTP